MKTRHLVLGAAAAIALGASTFAIAQTTPNHGGPGDVKPTMQQHGTPMMGMSGHHHMGSPGMPTMPGQAAFGTIQEIVRMLEADPKTDWLKVNLAALREHLIDMDEVTMKAVATENAVDGGLEIAVTGIGRTLDAIQRMIPAHARELSTLNAWTAKTSSLPDGILLTVTTTDAKDVAHVRGLGFIGLLASGSHHQPHHLAMAKGERHIH